MRKPEYYAAVYGILEDSQGQILFIKRKNTGYQDGLYGLPAGHIEGYETYFEALKREVMEEVGIELEEETTHIAHICHRIKQNERVYFDIYFIIKEYVWVPIIGEPEKCSEIIFLDWKSMDKNNFQPFSYEILEKIYGKKQEWNTISHSEIFT